MKAVAVRKVIRSKKQSGEESEEERIEVSLRSRKYPNIIALLTSYNLHSMHNLIFPLAQGDLKALLRGEMQCPPNLCQEHTILRETYGLSSAIEVVHAFFVGNSDLTLIGCHHNLKPENVLVKDEKFLLTDFGLSRLERAEEWSQELKKLQGFYFAPECESV